MLSRVIIVISKLQKTIIFTQKSRLKTLRLLLRHNKFRSSQKKSSKRGRSPKKQKKMQLLLEL
jgi:hypothetical protein